MWGDFARALAGGSNDPMTALAEVAPHLTGHVLWGRPQGESKLVFRAQLTEAGEAALAQRSGVQVSGDWLTGGACTPPSQS